MSKKNYIIEIKETNQKELYRKSVENMRIKQYQEQDDMRVELAHREKYIGSPIPLEQKKEWLHKLVEKYLHYKKNKEVKYLL